MCQRTPLKRVLHRVLVEADYLARVEVAPEGSEDGGAVAVAALVVADNNEGPGPDLRLKAGRVTGAWLGGRGHVADDLPPEGGHRPALPGHHPLRGHDEGPVLTIVTPVLKLGPALVMDIDLTTGIKMRSEIKDPS